MLFWAKNKKKKQLESDIASNTAVLNSTIETIAEKEKYIASLTDKEKLLKEFIEIEKQEFENHKNATLQSLEQREKELKQSESNYIKESFGQVLLDFLVFLVLSLLILVVISINQPFPCLIEQIKKLYN